MDARIALSARRRQIETFYSHHKVYIHDKSTASLGGRIDIYIHFDQLTTRMYLFFVLGRIYLTSGLLSPVVIASIR